MEMQVDPDVLRLAAARYRRTAGEIRDVLGRLNGTAHGLGSAAVLGDAGTAGTFASVWLNWSVNVRQLATALDNVAGALETTAEDYTLTDDDAIDVAVGGPQ